MKVSVVTISFNQAPFLRQCIESVLNQDYYDIEYIVVDPGSKDNSREIIDSYGDRIIKIFSPDCGPADGLNKGFSRASGGIYYFINSDDFLLPNCISKIVDIFENDPALDVLLSAGYEVDRLGNFVRMFYPSKVSAKLYVNGAVTFFQQGMFFRANIFKTVNGFNIENRTCWDGELLLSFILLNAKFTRLMTHTAAFRIYSESITGSQRFATKYKSDQDRLFRLVYGDVTMHGLKVTAALYRLRKIAFDPVYLFYRILATVSRPYL